MTCMTESDHQESLIPGLKLDHENEALENNLPSPKEAVSG